MKVIPLGYAMPGAEETLLELLSSPEWMIVDIRRSPYANRWLASWGGAALKKRYPEQYVHIPELGNLNYQPENRHKGIVLADPDVGIAKIREILETGKKLVLLCGCKDYNKCHRKKVYDLIQAADFTSLTSIC